MSVTLEFDFRPDGTLEDVWKIGSLLSGEAQERLRARLTSMSAAEKNFFMGAVVSALGREGYRE